MCNGCCTASKSTHDIMSQLQTHATVLEAELDEINKDLRTNRTFGKKYGLDAFREGEIRLLRLREEKRFQLEKISEQITKLNLSIRSSLNLAENLSSQQYVIPISDIQTSPKQQSTPKINEKKSPKQMSSQLFRDSSLANEDANVSVSNILKSSIISPRVIISKNEGGSLPPYSIITNSPILANSTRKHRTNISITPL